MTGGRGHGPKRTKWTGIPKVRCNEYGCKKRVRSDPELKYCNKHLK